jgi:hypothetical protein
MGREVRRVPKGWQHPKRKRFNPFTMREEESYQPMFDRSFAEAMEEWYAAWKAWERGERPSYCDEESAKLQYWEWNGGPPDPEYYMPQWPESERTHLVMYENTSEGTPISPAFETPEELARWLADNGASAFGNDTATYEQWLATCKAGWAMTAVMENGVMSSGVAHMATHP